MTNDGHPNPTSPPTSNEEAPSSSGDPLFRIDELPEPVLSGDEGAVLSGDEGAVLSEIASNAKH